MLHLSLTNCFTSVIIKCDQLNLFECLPPPPKKKASLSTLFSHFNVKGETDHSLLVILKALEKKNESL